MFCKFFLFKSNGLEAKGFSPKNRFCFNRAKSDFDFSWPAGDILADCADFNYGSCMAEIWQDPVLSQLPDWAFAEERHWINGQMRTCGIVVKSHVRDRENLFATLLGFARRNGLSIADPSFGFLLITPQNDSIRERTWMRLRRIDILDWIKQTTKPGPSRLFSLGEHNAESFYALVGGGCYGKPQSKMALRFREALKEALFPDEHLELFRGRVVIAGPNEAYRIHFNWEGCGKQSGWTADFTDPEAPIVPLGRISIRMLKKHVVEFKRFPPGMFDPRIMERIPDPADRYASLALWNHKLTKRIPREILDDYKTQPPPEALAKGSDSSG